MKSKNNFHSRKNQKGTIAVDFIFAFTLACLLSMMILAITATYTVIEISQYIAFSGARAMAAADSDITKQSERGKAKINSLLNNSVLRPLLSANEWFAVTLKDVKTGGSSAFGGDQDSYASEYAPFIFNRSNRGDQFIPQVGLRLSFEAKILNFNLSFLGRTGNNEGEGYKATVTGFLIREPTQNECLSLINQQKMTEAIKALDSRYQSVMVFTGNSQMPLEDNGC